MMNQLIEVVKQQETSGNDGELQADRTLTQDEHHQILELLSGRNDTGTTAMINFQHHLIAKTDEVAHVRKNTLKTGSNLI